MIVLERFFDFSDDELDPVTQGVLLKENFENDGAMQTTIKMILWNAMQSVL
jgi:hypothetical protein